MAQKRVLIIEDSPETQQLLAELVLEPSGYRPIAALNGEDGLQIALDEPPDLIILDMQLPKMSGIAVLEALQQRDVDIPVIFTTIRESPELIVQAFRLGARDYVIKPFDPQEMQEAIQRAFATARVHEERDQLTQQLQRQLQELNAVYAIGRSVTSLLDLNRVLNRVVEAAVYMTDAEEGMLLLLDDESGELYLRAAKGIDEKAVRSLRVRVDDSTAGRALRTDRPVLLTGEQAKVSTGYLVKALLYLPLRAPERGGIGVLGVVNRETGRPFSERDIFLLSALADYAAIAIENARLFEAAEVERAKLEAVLQEAQGVIIVVDENDKVLLCNTAARAALNLAETDLLRHPIGEAIPYPSLREMFAQVRETEKATHSEVPLKDGRTFNAQITPIEGVGRVLVMQDITHLKELDRIKSEFVATVSHDLRTPLTTIQGYIELLPRVGPLNEQQQEFILRARESIETITELISDLLDIGRIEAGFDLEMTSCDLGQVIEEIVGEFRPRAEHKKQELHWQPSETLLLVQGNPNRLRQVMDNLLGNAIKYTQEGGRISVSASEDTGHIVVHVADNGLGIHHTQQPYIFDKFYRVESDETADIKGTGLGLAIVKAVIEKHNGRVWVESKPGIGSVFSFVLPSLEA
ncbi:MAG: ATP-binding protein [Chloroflexota bacterium]|nr:ATP-binding protein [Chloroflexota bacterium]